MKKIFLIIALIATFYVGLYVEHTYTMDGVVVGRNTIEDATGKIWKFAPIHYASGSAVKIYFNDACTDSRDDDSILRITSK